MNKKYGNLYVEDRIPKDTYRGMEVDNKQATVMNLLVAHQNMDDKTAYSIVKAVFEHIDEMVRVHGEAQNFKLENQKTAAAGGIPWHPGAAKYYAERGVKLK
jgi:TRAP transporter TAXI family solute receptor